MTKKKGTYMTKGKGYHMPAPKGGKGMGKQILSVVGVIVLLCIIGVVWAFPRTLSLDVSDSFDKAQVEEKAKEIIRLYSEEDYEGLKENAAPSLSAEMNEEGFEKANIRYDSSWGALKSFGELSGTEMKRMGDTSAMVRMTAVYENARAEFTMSFNKELKLGGFYVEEEGQDAAAEDPAGAEAQTD